MLHSDPNLEDEWFPCTHCGGLHEEQELDDNGSCLPCQVKYDKRTKKQKDFDREWGHA